MTYIKRIVCNKCNNDAYIHGWRTHCHECGYSNGGKYYSAQIGRWHFIGWKFWFMFPYPEYEWVLSDADTIKCNWCGNDSNSKRRCNSCGAKP